ncbi:MAG: hypothetical protein H6982_07895 [Chromatiales bacterium]|nr:hypothetical protein [Chromatiales bacterium]
MRSCFATFDLPPPNRPSLGEVVGARVSGTRTPCATPSRRGLGRALSRFYLRRFGLVLHHNVDKVLYGRGARKTDPRSAAARWSGRSGSSLAGQATLEHREFRVDPRHRQGETCQAWLAANHALDAHAHVRIHTLITPARTSWSTSSAQAQEV